MDFVILCIGKYNDLPNIPDFPINKGPDIFNGKVIHSMDHVALGGNLATKFINEKRVTIIGLQKSVVDVVAKVATKNSKKHLHILDLSFFFLVLDP